MSTPLLLLIGVFLKPPFEGVTGYPQNTHTNDSESLKGVLCKYSHSINTQLYVIVYDFYIYEINITIPDSVAKQNKNQHLLL